jgi:hypothetical protein
VSDDFDKLKAEDDFDKLPSAEGEPGQAGHDIYADGPNAHVPKGRIKPLGTAWDAAKSWADTAALGAGPQISGAMGAMAHSLTDPAQLHGTDLDAYRSVRDDTKRDLEQAEDTHAGETGSILGAFSTPIPVKALPRGAALAERALQSGKVGGGLGLIHGLATSKADLTNPSYDDIGRAIRDSLMGGAEGFIGGATGGAVLGAAQPKLEGLAETQALRAAGLRGGISNQLRQQLGVENMSEARQLGRQFLDEGLIPAVGSAESVGKRAQALEGQAGGSVGSIMNEADVSTMRAPQPQPIMGQTSAGRPSNMPQPKPGFDFDAMSKASHGALNDSTMVAEGQASKARALADAFAAQEQRTPGSFVGANKAKSDAWRSANFSADAPMAAVLYRKAVGAGRDDIARQVAQAIGPGRAADLAAANKKYGIAADALKLAENATTRDAAKKGIGMHEALALLGGATAGGGAHGLSGGVSGAGAGLAASLGMKALDKYGHSTAARGADWLAKQAGSNTGAGMGSASAEALAEYLKLLREKK